MLLKLLWSYFRIGVMNELAYRANFLVQMFQSLFSLGTSLAGLAVVFSQTSNLAGWRPAELVAVLGVYTLMGGVINLVIQPSMQRLMEDVRLGTLDFSLTKPVDSQVLESVQQVQIWRLADVAMGIVLLVLALGNLGTQVGPGEALVFGLMLLCGAAIVYSFWLMLATCSFWFVKVDNILVIFQTMYEAGRWPVTIYPGWLRFTLTFLVPVAFAITVPAEAVSGRLGWGTLVGAVALAAALVAFSRWFWLTGVRHYSGASA